MQGKNVSNKTIIAMEEAVKKTLGTPFFGDLPDNGLKVRRNLLAVSTIAITMFFSNAQISQKSTFLGLQFDGFNDLNLISTLLLLLINCYLFIHFLLYALEAWNEWKLRLTGKKVVHTTGPGT